MSETMQHPDSFSKPLKVTAGKDRGAYASLIEGDPSTARIEGGTDLSALTRLRLVRQPSAWFLA